MFGEEFSKKEKLDDCTYFGRLFRRWSKFRNQTRPLTQLNTPSVVARFYWISTTQTSAMSYSISTLLTRNLHDVFGENDPARRRSATRSSPKIACSTSPGASTVAATRSIASRARSGLLTLTSDISRLPGPRNWAMAGGSNGYRAGLVRRQLTPGLISSLSGTAGLPPFISFSTSYPDLHSLAPSTSNITLPPR